jgi:nuclear GTP-binding protein
MVKREKGGRTTKLKDMSRNKSSMAKKGSKSGSSIHKSNASTNPFRADPSGGKKGS